MRILVLISTALILLGSLLFHPAPLGAADPGGEFYTRIRANDAPIGGRFSVFGYFLDGLDEKVPQTGDGRVLLLIFRDANGKNSFVIPGDLALEDSRGVRLTTGFHPVGEQRLHGEIHKDDVRYALWWVPRVHGRWEWNSPTELTLRYGTDSRAFYPLPEGDEEGALRQVPWDIVEGLALDADRPVTRIEWEPDPFSFDTPPVVQTGKKPVYSANARRFNMKGVVHVVARVGLAGAVEDLFVVESNAAHELNVSALVAVKSWIFKPGVKDGQEAAGEVIVPIRFTESETP